jgi:hypothetical protein
MGTALKSKYNFKFGGKVSFSFTVGICTYSIKYCYTISYDKVE